MLNWEPYIGPILSVVDWGVNQLVQKHGQDAELALLRHMERVFSERAARLEAQLAHAKRLHDQR